MLFSTLKQNLDPTVHNYQFKKANDKNDAFILDQMKEIVSRGYAYTSRVYTGHICGLCQAVLSESYKAQVKDWSRSTRRKPVYILRSNTRRFKNATVAMLKGKHKANCKFARAVSVLVALGEL